MINIIKKIPLFHCKTNLYSGAIFCDNRYNFFNAKDNQIDIYDECLEKIECVNSCNHYTSITSRCDCELFYAVKCGDDSNLYVLNKDYCEIDKVELKIPRNYMEPIKSIAYDCKNCRIIIATKTKVYSVTLDGYFIRDELSKSAIEEISIKYTKSQTIKDNCGCYTTNSCQVVEPYITSVGIFCFKKYIAYIKDNSAFIAMLTDNGNIVKSYYVDDNIAINALLNVCNKMELLITKSKDYNFIYKTDYKCCTSLNCIKNCCECNCLEQKSDCDYLECDSKCCECECNDNCDKCKNKSCKDNCIDIIASVALIETALSHILNAEGEKIQKAIAMSDDLCELIKTNDSVTKVIYNVTMLEQLLLEKLHLVLDKSDLCCDDCDCNNDCNCEKKCECNENCDCNI